MSATALKSTKQRFSSLNHQNFEFFRLVPRSPTHTGLIFGKTLEPNISSLDPFKNKIPLSFVFIFVLGTKFKLFSLSRNSSERNFASLLLFLFHGTEFRAFFSSTEWFWTEFREFSVPLKSWNSVGTNHLFRDFVYSVFPRIFLSDIPNPTQTYTVT
jgi:hypothetical protein